MNAALKFLVLIRCNLTQTFSQNEQLSLPGSLLNEHLCQRIGACVFLVHEFIILSVSHVSYLSVFMFEISDNGP